MPAAKRPATIWIQFVFNKLEFTLDEQGDMQSAVIGTVMALGTDLHSKKESQSAVRKSGLPEVLRIGKEVAFQIDEYSARELSNITWSQFNPPATSVMGYFRMAEELEAKVRAYRRDWESFIIQVPSGPIGEESHWSRDIVKFEFRTDKDAPKNCVINGLNDLIAEEEARANS